MSPQHMYRNARRIRSPRVAGARVAVTKMAAMAAQVAAAMAVVAFGSTPGFAQRAPPSDTAMVNLVRLLVEQKMLTPQKGAALMAQAQAEASQARTPSGPTTAQVAAAGQPSPADLPPAAVGVVRVPYVPETVRAQIKDELRNEVMSLAKAERWAAPDQAAPSWVNALRIHGDLRFRSASALYSNANSRQIVDVSRWNATGPYDVQQATLLLPILNATNDRINTAQIRARLGIDAVIADRFQVGLQLATGDDPGPISTNASLGGGFRKRDFWLQNAYLRGTVVDGVTAMIGRFDNPFRTTDLMFDPDLAFDGVYGEMDFGKLLNPGVTIVVRGGALPINFGDDNFPSLSANKRNFRDRYLYTGQLEIGKKFGDVIEAHAAAAYHDFTYLRGHVSDPCDVYSNDRIECSTDALRPEFMGKGNTWAYLRQFDLTNLNPGEAVREPQYIGYKFAYRVFDASASVSIPIAHGVTAMVTGNYLHNFGFDPKNVCAEGVAGQPQNNFNDNAGVCAKGSTARFLGGDDGYAAYVSLGHPNLFRVNPGRAHKGQWAVNAAYKYLESDAVPDAFTDSDFHLGGTNAKGYIIGGAYAPFDGIAIGARWLSSNEIVDQPLAIDVLQLDLNVAF